MTPQTILHKTELGRATIAEKGSTLSRAERNVLVLADGKRSLSDLMQMTGVHDQQVITHLLSLGMLEPVGGQPAPSAAPPTTTASVDVPELRKPMPPVLKDNPFERTYSFLTSQIPEFFGFTAFTLTLKLEKASSLDDLEPVKQKLLEVIEKKRGKAVADQYRARFDAMARE